MRKKRYPFIIAIIILGLVIVAAELFFDLKLSFNRSAASMFDGFSNEGSLENQVSLLEKENADLKAALFQETVVPADSAIVYSSYPFNSKSKLVISWGVDMGVKVGDTATYGTKIFVGRVTEVTQDKSVVTTIYDPGFETPVRIGNGGIDALMRGGNELTLEFIPSDAKIEVGDRVITAGSELPYGLELGKITEIHVDNGSVFQEATIKPSFDIKTLKDVNILF